MSVTCLISTRDMTHSYTWRAFSTSVTWLAHSCARHDSFTHLWWAFLTCVTWLCSLTPGFPLKKHRHTIRTHIHTHIHIYGNKKAPPLPPSTHKRTSPRMLDLDYQKQRDTKRDVFVFLFYVLVCIWVCVWFQSSLKGTPGRNERVLSRRWRRHTTCTNESCHTYEWGLLHTCE